MSVLDIKYLIWPYKLPTKPIKKYTYKTIYYKKSATIAVMLSRPFLAKARLIRFSTVS